MDLPNKKYIPYIYFGIASVLFTISLFIFKPFIKMLELYTLFVRVPAKSLEPVLDFGSENFIISGVVPMIPNVEFFNYPFIFDLFYCTAGISLLSLFLFLIPNFFVGVCLALSTILGLAMYSVYMSQIHSVWIPIIWPALIQIFFLLIFIALKIHLKQTKQLSTIKLFGYDINLFPASIPFIKNIVQAPKKQDVTMCCFRIKIPQIFIEENSPENLIYNINEVFKIIIDNCLKNSGIIDKTSNNTILVYWIGENHAQKAIDTAIEIQNILRKNMGVIKVSCGITTENSIFAILGSENFANYTLIGNIVDIATRLENACIFHNTSILISEKTLDSLEKKITVAHKGVISVHGINKQINFYEPQNFVEENISYIKKLGELLND